MILESSNWKDGLLGYAAKLERWSRQRRITERTEFLIERETFFAFYSIRKLAEAQKISPVLLKIPLVAESYPRSRAGVLDGFNSHKIDQFYDLSKPKTVSLERLFICNQFIHSFIFVLSVNDNGSLGGFLVNSDKTKSRGLYLIDLPALLRFVTDVGNDDPWMGSWVRDKGTGEMRRIV